MSRKSQSLDVPVNVIMDEFIAIGKIPDFEQKLATVRSAGISISMIFQQLASVARGISERNVGVATVQLLELHMPCL